MIRILLVDDHNIVRTGFRSLLAEVKDFSIVGEAGTGEQALSFITTTPVDVVLMDIRMPGIGGLEATRRLLRAKPSLKIIVLSELKEDPYPYHLMTAGVKGYLTKTCRIDQVIEAIYKVFSDEMYFAPEIMEQLAFKKVRRKENTSPFSLLSAREMQVVFMLLNGDGCLTIAKKLHLSDKTVSTYRYRLFEKLGVKSDMQLMQLAQCHGILSKPSDV